MSLAHDTLVLVADGRKALFLRNHGDEQQIELFTLFHTLEYVSQKAFTREEMEGFSGEARGSPSGGDNTSDLGCRSLCRHLDE